jgi:hypothetical protein
MGGLIQHPSNGCQLAADMKTEFSRPLWNPTRTVIETRTTGAAFLKKKNFSL